MNASYNTRIKSWTAEGLTCKSYRDIAPLPCPLAHIYPVRPSGLPLRKLLAHLHGRASTPVAILTVLLPQFWTPGISRNLKAGFSRSPGCVKIITSFSFVHDLCIFFSICQSKLHSKRNWTLIKFVERFVHFRPEYVFQSAVLTRKDENINTRLFKYDRDWFVCKQAALRSSCATLREWSHNLHPPSCSG